MAIVLERDTAKLEIDDTGLARLSLGRPDGAFVLGASEAADLRAAAVHLSNNDGARAVLLTTSGPLFCGGGDLAAFGGHDAPAELISEITIDLHAALARLARIDAPVVAAVHGTAGGAGMSLVAAFDLVVSADTAKFTMGYTKAGLVPDGSSSFYLARCVGLKRAMDLVLTNRVLSADEAESWGLVSRVVPAADVHSEAEALATALAAGPTRSFGAAKRVIMEGASSALEEAMERESAAIAAAVRSADGQEGIAAFLGKRPPEFTGE